MFLIAQMPIEPGIERSFQRDEHLAEGVNFFLDLDAFGCFTGKDF